MVVMEQCQAPSPKATMEDYFVFKARMEFLELWRETYGGVTALHEAERLYKMRRNGDKRLPKYLEVHNLHLLRLGRPRWYWRRTGEWQKAEYRVVCPRCLPGPPGSKPYQDGRYVFVWKANLEVLSGRGPWDLVCSNCECEGTVHSDD